MVEFYMKLSEKHILLISRYSSFLGQRKTFVTEEFGNESQKIGPNCANSIHVGCIPCTLNWYVKRTLRLPDFLVFYDRNPGVRH